MAYNVEYQGSFYNRFSKIGTVQLLLDGGTTYSPEAIRIKEVQLQTNYQGNDTPVIGMGAKVVIVNNTDDFNTYSELLSNYERQWMCKIFYNSEIVFEGFLICDINEQQLLPNSEIVLQFTNYLRRLEDVYTSAISVMGDKSTVSYILTHTIGYYLTNLFYSIYFNSTLFESKMTSESPSVFADQTYIENALFYNDANEYDNLYTVINKLLKPFGAFFYSYGQKWIVERFGDITRDGDWVMLPSTNILEATPSLKKQINKQAGDFKYINASQTLQYNSGVKTLKIDLMDKLIGSLVYSNFEMPFIENSASPAYPSDLEKYHTWYMDQYVDPDISFVRYNYRNEISKYFYAQNGNVAYKFSLQFTTLANELSISFKTVVTNPSAFSEVNARIAITVKVIGLEFWISEDALGFVDMNTGNPEPLEILINVGSLDSESVVTITKSLVGLSTWWDVWGNPDVMDICINFMQFRKTSGGDDIYAAQYIGDISVVINEMENIENQITNTINGDFVKEATIDLDVFDLNNLNYLNGPYVLVEDSSGAVNDGFLKTEFWGTDGSTYDKSLVDLLVESKMKKLAQTTRKLIATISCDDFLKLFTIITDDDIENSSSDIVKFILTNFTWDLVNGTYEIEAEEYPDTEIVITT